MKLTSDKALELLKEAEQTTSDLGWISHSKCVGETAGIIAEKLGLDVDKAITLGYIHDIGKRTDFKNHVMKVPFQDISL